MCFPSMIEANSKGHSRNYICTCPHCHSTLQYMWKENDNPTNYHVICPVRCFVCGILILKRRRNNSMIKILRHGHPTKYIADCDECNAQIECPYIHILCPVCGKALPAYSFVEIKND